MGVENAMFVAMGAAAMLVVMGAAAMLDVAGLLPIPMLTGILGCCELNKYALYVYVDKQNKQSMQMPIYFDMQIIIYLWRCARCILASQRERMQDLIGAIKIYGKVKIKCK